MEPYQQLVQELETVLDAAGDAIMVVGTDFRLQRANASARRWFSNRLGRVPMTLAEFRELARPEHADGGDARTLGVEQALRGERAEEELTVSSADGTRRIHVVSAPLRDPTTGKVTGAVVAARDITELHRAITERARLDGAIKTARLAAHELNNKLSYLTGYGELLAGMLQGEPGQFAQIVAEGARDAAKTLQRLQEIIRFEETEFGGQVMLDLEASTGRE